MHEDEGIVTKRAGMRLDGMGVAELEAHIAGLRAEIARAEAEIERKKGHRAAAEGVFRG